MADCLAALITRDKNDIDRALASLIVSLKLPGLEEEGVIKGIIGVFRGDVSAIHDLAYALRIDQVGSISADRFLF